MFIGRDRILGDNLELEKTVIHGGVCKRARRRVLENLFLNRMGSFSKTEEKGIYDSNVGRKRLYFYFDSKIVLGVGRGI